MKQVDHRALAHDLLEYAGTSRVFSHGGNRRAFLLGCICPDYLPLTYLRGVRRSHAMRGHDARYSAAFIRKTLDRLHSRGVRSLRDCYTLGCLMHYLADSFTHAHNVSFSGDMRAHRRYEAALHQRFAQHLRYSAHKPRTKEKQRETPHAHWYRVRRDYERGTGGYERDCRAILEVCRSVFLALLEK